MSRLGAAPPDAPTRFDDAPLSTNVKILPQTPQLMGMHTVIHNTLTDREEFLFYFDRMATLLVEKALDHLDYAPTEITTKQELAYVGCKLAGSGEVSLALLATELDADMVDR